MKAFAERIKEHAYQLGFDQAGITGSEPLTEAHQNLMSYLNENRHGTMEWLATTATQRANPAAFYPDTRSILMVAHNYYREREEIFMPIASGTISLYARGRDYHRVIRKKLKSLLSWIQEQKPEASGRVFVDSFPIMEKPLAVRAGLGWIAKNTTLIMKTKGSYFFLGGILLNIQLPPDEPFTQEFCGECSRCQQACPTGAITGPFRLDSRRCISYLTIEHTGVIDEAISEKTGNHIFGCDICQAVCPWNQRFAKSASEPDYSSRFSETDLLLNRLASLTKEEFEAMFEGTPVRRAGYKRFMRNVETARENMPETDEQK